MRDMGFGERRASRTVRGERRAERCAVIFNGIADRSRHLIAGGVGEADIQHAVTVAAGQVDSLVDCSENVRLEQVEAAEDAHFRTISIQQISMLRHLGQLHLGHVHESIDLEFGAFEVLDTERVDCDHLDTTFITDFQDLVEEQPSQYQIRNTSSASSLPRALSSPVRRRGKATYPSQRLKSQIMTLHSLNSM